MHDFSRKSCIHGASETSDRKGVWGQALQDFLKRKIDEFSYSIAYNYYRHLYFNLSYSDHMI